MQRCLCIFLKYPEPGRVKTRLAKDLGNEKAAQIYSSLVREVIRQARAAKPDKITICFDPPAAKTDVQKWLSPWISAFPGEIEYLAQSQGDLGDRLSSAMDHLFNPIQHGTLDQCTVLNDENLGVLIVGTDCIELDPESLAKAWERLEKDPASLVIGPTFDGGYYLIGLAQPAPHIFRDIPWSTESTFDATVETAKSHQQSYSCLPEKTDIDTINEYQSFVSHLETQPCVFFDRDGVINHSPGPGYILNTEQFHLSEGIADCLKIVRQKGYRAIVITSQKGIGKGLMSQTDLDDIHHKMQQELLDQCGETFDAIYAYTGEPNCSHQPKPNPEMILTAAEQFPIDLSRSWMIGDADRDIEMGKNAKLAGTVRIRGEKSISIEADHSLNSVTELVNLFNKTL